MTRKISQNIKLESVKDKSTLVKLLAEEDVTVTYQKAQTASFNPVTRQVILPIWKDKSESVMDMMSLHEVGHALYTPASLLEDGHKKQVKHSFLNVLEDVRIEKMIQDKYLGSRKVFKTAYTELLKKDFFGVNGKDLSKLNLIDRINLHYKNVPNVPFDNDELEWVDKANQTKTPEDVLNLAIELQEWMYANQKQTESDDMFKLDIEMPDEKSEDKSEGGNSESDDSNSSEDGDQESDDTDGNGDSDSDDEKDSDDKSENGKSSDDKQSDEKENAETASYGKGTGHDDSDFNGIEARTDENYQKKQYDSVDNDAKGIEYLNIPKVNLKEIIVDYKRVNKELTEYYNEKVKGRESNQKFMDYIKKDIVKFKKEQSQTISYMVKEFEMRKSADLYKRSTVAKTGQLNMNTLHSYSYNEDIFLKMNVEPGATNHGLVMFVDWSGSMFDNFYNTIKQTLNLVWFCERVNIPFEVYGFTNGYGRDRGDSNKHIHAQKRKQDDMIINELTLLNLLSSRANKKDMQEGLENIWAYAHYYGSQLGQTNMPKNEYGYDSMYPISPAADYQLYSTPLNHTIVAAMDLVPKFKKDNGLQKVHTVFLTDGASNTIDHKYDYTMQDFRPINEQYDSNEKYIPLPDDYQGTIQSTHIVMADRTLIVTDPVTKKKYIEEKDENDYYRRFSYSKQTEILLSFLKERLPEMSITNFFIASRNRKGTLSKNDIARIFELSSWEDEDKIKSIQKEILKNNVAVCKTGGWDEMYVLPGGSKLDVSDDNMSEITPGTAKTGELKKAFSKMSSGRKNSRPLLNKFIGMIA
jgi:hypothetical protein